MRRLAVFVGFGTLMVAIAVGCGGGTATGTGTGAPSGTGSGTGSGSELEAGSEPGSAPDAGVAAAPLTDEECAQMADHMIDAQLEAKRAAGEELPEPGQIDEIRRGIKRDFVPECAGKFSREVFDCWMGATSQNEFESCAGGPPPPEK